MRGRSPRVSLILVFLFPVPLVLGMSKVRTALNVLRSASPPRDNREHISDEVSVCPNTVLQIRKVI